MNIETTKMSSRGQIVIPQEIREDVKADEWTIFIVTSNKDTIILNKMQKPSKEQLIKDLEKMAKEGRRRLEAMGVKEEDIPGIIHRHRGIKEWMSFLIRMP